MVFFYVFLSSVFKVDSKREKSFMIQMQKFINKDPVNNMNNLFD